MRTFAPLFAASLVIAFIAGAAANARAQEYPARPVKLVVPNAPGSSIDTLGRIVAARMGEPLGQPIAVENRAGASGVLGMEIGRAAAADGYTLVLASASNLSIAPLAQKGVPYDPLNDFAFVSTIALLPNVLVAHNALPVKNVKELLDHARANPGRVNMSSAGPGSASHLGGVLLQAMVGFESLHVPYKGGGPSMAALVSGESHWSITPAPAAREALASQGAEVMLATPEEFRAFLARNIEATAKIMQAAGIKPE